jgi:hypothetical protein
MEPIDSESFDRWCKDFRIGRSVQYPKSEALTYLPEPGFWYRYRPNTTPHGLGAFVDSALDVASAGVALLVIPTGPGACWFPPDDQDSPNLRSLAGALVGAGVPRGLLGAMRFDARERPLVTLLLTGALQFGAPFWEFSVFPEHGRCIILNDEDGDLIGRFPTESALRSYTAALKRAGWNEPTEPDPRVSETDPWLNLPSGS